MSGVDRAWLHMGHRDNPMVISGFFAFAEHMDVDLLRSLVWERMQRFPRFLQRPVEHDGPLRWDAADVDMTWHVREEVLAGPGEAHFQWFLGTLISQPLLRDRPLWQMTVVQRPEGGSAVFVRIHHAIGDGIALLKVLLSLCDHPPVFEGRTGSAGTGKLHVPAHVLSHVRELLPRRHHSASAIEATRAVLQDGLGMLRHPGQLRDLAAAGVPWASALLRLTTLPPDPPTAVKGRLTGAKKAAWAAPVQLDAVKAAGRRHGATLNDLVVAAVAGAVRGYLTSGGQSDVPALRALIPINLRPPGGAPRLGNYFGLVLPELPVDEPDPLGRLHRSQAEMGRIKGSVEPAITFALLQAVGHAAAVIEENLLRFFSKKTSMVLTNVPGPRSALTLAGRTITDLMFWVPQAGDLGLGFSVMSYDGEVRIGVMTDAGVIPEPHRLVRGVEEELRRLGVRC